MQKYIEQNYPNRVAIFTDGSKEPENGCSGAAAYIPEFKVPVKERANDQASVYTVELLAITLALRWSGETTGPMHSLHQIAGQPSVVLGP